MAGDKGGRMAGYKGARADRLPGATLPRAARLPTLYGAGNGRKDINKSAYPLKVL